MHVSPGAHAQLSPHTVTSLPVTRRFASVTVGVRAGSSGARVGAVQGATMNYKAPELLVLGEAGEVTLGGEWVPAPDWLTGLRARPR